MGTIETFDHTADVGLRVRGGDLPDVFRTAAEGVFDYIVANRSEVKVAETERLALAADSPLDLLVTWLNELIFRSETRHRLYTRFEVVIGPDGRTLEATIGGEPVDASRHILDHEVKAVTHHGETLVQEGSGWRAELILDI
ncbi:MAG: archease [Isosphaeraceae bacterium]|nr:archease [Isosphaeraceae bacterium]